MICCNVGLVSPFPFFESDPQSSINQKLQGIIMAYSVTNSHWSSSSFMYEPASIYRRMNNCIFR